MESVKIQYEVKKVYCPHCSRSIEDGETRTEELNITKERLENYFTRDYMFDHEDEIYDEVEEILHDIIQFTLSSSYSASVKLSQLRKAAHFIKTHFPNRIHIYQI